MPVIPPSRLIALQSQPQNIRNICILAHVDHGKTSLTDSLIATNGIISPKMAGKIRYLDSRPDEQTRGITMESSAISLHFGMSRKSSAPSNGASRGTNGSSADGGGVLLNAEVDVTREDYLINLIDSPGHIDFSSEVSTASRLSDAAVILVDAVEGVCSQTVTVLRQVWIEKLKPLLVINKIDRLVTELKMSPPEAYSHLERVLEGVNAVIGGFFQGERMEEDLLWREKAEERRQSKRQRRCSLVGEGDIQVEEGLEQQFEERDDEDLYFAPEKNNVIFASALDGWAFTVGQFAGIYEKKLGIKRSILEQVLWGDFYLDPRTKKVLGQKHLKGRALKPIFVQLVLDPIWTVYEATNGGGKGKGDQALLEKVTKSLSITLPPHILRSREPKAVLQAVFAAWLPLSTALLVSVIEYLPSPPDAQAARLPEMLDESPGAEAISPQVRDAMINFRTGEDAPTVAYVSKMVAIPESELPANKRRGLGTTLTVDEAREMARRKRAEIAKAQAEANEDNGSDGISNGMGTLRIGEDVEEATAPKQPEDPEHLIGFARLYSGSLSVGDEIYVLPPKYNPAHPHAMELRKVPIKALYLLMGRGLEPLQTVPAGAVFGVQGLEGHILKTGTLCSQLEGAVNLAGVSLPTQPIVRVALEPVNPTDLNKMVRGLKLLEQSDPCALYEQLESGEHVILTAGELHLERCLKDLRERFARCEIQAGEPIVPYRETIVKTEEMEPPKSKDLLRGTTIAVTSSKHVSVRLRVRPLPIEVTQFLIRHAGSIRRLYSEKKAAEEQTKKGSGEEVHDRKEEPQDQLEMDDTVGAERGTLSMSEFRQQLEAAFQEVEEDGDVWNNAVRNLAAFGPRRVGPNLFLDITGSNTLARFFTDLNPPIKGEQRHGLFSATVTPADFSDTISYAFQLATHQGPLCREPMQGVAVFLESITLNPNPSNQITFPESKSSSNTLSLTAPETPRLPGELITSIRSSIRTAFLDWPARIMLAIYSCTIQATPEVLGRVYSVLTRRRGSILSESLLEGTPYFTITSTLPVAESFGFSDEIRKRTSGLAQPMLVFTGFEILDDVDPKWVPKTEEELEDLGEFGDRDNVAKKYVDAVRRRKGLLVKGLRGVGRDAEKQRTLKTN
jgi:ribosome assembly protein 1